MAGYPERLFQRQITSRGISDPRLLKALRDTDRRRFVPNDLRHWAYRDSPLPIGSEQTISQPFIVAWMLQMAQIQPIDRVLEIGTGSGYQTALLAQLCETVYTIEIRENLLKRARPALESFENIQYRLGDGYLGWPEAGPFDVIVLSAAPPKIPVHLPEQLALEGRCILPVGASRKQKLVKLTRYSNWYQVDFREAVTFVPLVQFDQPPPLMQKFPTRHS